MNKNLARKFLYFLKNNLQYSKMSFKIGFNLLQKLRELCLSHSLSLPIMVCLIKSNLFTEQWIEFLCINLTKIKEFYKSE